MEATVSALANRGQLRVSDGEKTRSALAFPLAELFLHFLAQISYGPSRKKRAPRSWCPFLVGPLVPDTHICLRGLCQASTYTDFPGCSVAWRSCLGSLAGAKCVHLSPVCCGRLKLATAGTLTRCVTSGLCLSGVLVNPSPLTTHPCQHLPFLNKGNGDFVILRGFPYSVPRYFKLLTCCWNSILISSADEAFPWFFCVSPGYFNAVTACGVGMDPRSPVIICFRSPCDVSSSHHPCKTWADLCRSLFAALIITAPPNSTRSATNDSNLSWELMLTKHKLFSFCRGWSNVLWKTEALLDIHNQSPIDWGKI